MSKNAIPVLPLNILYETDEDLYFKLIKLHSVALNWNLSDKQIIILTYLIRFGYSKDVLNIISEETGLTRGSLSVHLSNLRKGRVGKKKIKKLIETHKTNINITVLTTELKDIKRMVENPNIKMVGILKNQ